MYWYKHNMCVCQLASHKSMLPTPSSFLHDDAHAKHKGTFLRLRELDDTDSGLNRDKRVATGQS